MGLFDFVKEAGEKLGFGGKDEPAAPAKAAPQAAPEPAAAAEQMQRAAARRLAMGIVRRIGELGLAVEDLEVRVDGEVAHVSGTAASQEVREKVVLAAGNVAGIAQVNDDGLKVAQPAATMYTVVPGDSLSKIAKAHYGDAMKYPVIFEANKPMLKDPDKIYPGQVLRIPPLED